jgi:hypothetical protein
MDELPYSPLDAQRELRRIGVDLERLPGLAANGLSAMDFLRWLRTIPGGIGHTAFLGRLHASPAAGGPHPPGPNEPPASDVATYVDLEMDEAKAFVQELRRVVPPSSLPVGAEGWGFDPPHGRAHALAVLRALPDGAGPDRLQRALEATPPLPDSSGSRGAGA